MKNKQLGELLKGIDACGNLTGVKFAYAMARNKKFLKTEIEILQEVINPSPEFIEYETKRIELCVKEAEKNKDGTAKTEPIIQNGQVIGGKYVFVDNEKFEKEFKEIQQKYKNVLDKRNEQIKNYNELLEKESPFVPYKIEISEVPQDISAEQMAGIIEIINENIK